MKLNKIKVTLNCVRRQGRAVRFLLLFYAHFQHIMTVELSDPPTDGISSLNFSPFNYSSFLLATSWDSSIYLYDCDKNRSVGKFSAGAAVLDGCFSETDQNVAYAVGLNRQIHR